MAQTPKQKMVSKVKRDMKALSTYKKEYDQLIEIYVDLLIQYDETMQEFERTGKQYETETAAGNPKKSGLVSTMEVLRKDIITYSDRLCLNPKSLEATNISPPEQKSKLVGLLASFEKKEV